MEAEGAWVVYFLDNYATVVSIWDNAADAWLSADKDMHYNVAFIKFGSEEVHKELNKQ